MKKYILIFIYLLSIFFLANAEIISVRTQLTNDSDNKNDNYQVGQSVRIIVQTDFLNATGTVEVYSEKA
ncbi:MAG: hypothetical protein ACQESP_10100, partial [Candidatus Muiribacteriota bacterium]